MKIVIAIDSFKGSLTSLEAGRAAEYGIKRVLFDAETAILPVADGGEGTVRALTEGMHGEIISLKVSGPLGDPVIAEYGFIKENATAVIEMASAAGLPLVPGEKRDPMHTTTYGVGEIILDAIERGAVNFYIGIGGSATNDGGVGMLSALGYRFLDASGNEIPKGAKGLGLLAKIETDSVHPALSKCHFNVACDVSNPLCGELGCSSVFAPQKGAKPEDIPVLDGYMAHYASVAAEVSSKADPNVKGAGAAGGMGFAFNTFLPSELRPGVDIVLEAIALEEHLNGCDLVITGEGRLDAQTVMGKAPDGVAKAAKKRGIPVIALAGCIGSGAEACNEAGIDAFFPIVRGAVSLEEAMKPENASKNMTDTVEQIIRTIYAFKGD